MTDKNSKRSYSLTDKINDIEQERSKEKDKYKTSKEKEKNDPKTKINVKIVKMLT